MSKKIKQIGIPEVNNLDDSLIVIQALSKSNKKKYNYRKLAEELTELADVCLKITNKQRDTMPEYFEALDKQLIEEIGDVQLRMNVLVEQLDVQKEVDDRVIFKSKKLLKLYNEGKYRTGL